MNTRSTLFSIAALALASTGMAKADVFADIEAAVPGSTVKLTEDVYYIELYKCITLDLNGHSIEVLHLRNQTGTITVKNGHIGNEIDGESGAGTAFCGTTILEDLKVDGQVWVDGHTCYIKSGTYYSVNNHHSGDRFGTVFISGNNTYVNSFNGGGWDYSGGEIILLGGTYPYNPYTDYSRVFVDPSRTVETLSSAPAGAPDESYIYQVYDDGTPSSLGVNGSESESNDDYMCANYIAANGNISGQLSADDEEDWLKVVIPEEGSLSITISKDESLGIHHTALHIIDNENQLKERNYNWYDGEHVIKDLAPGPYYICLKRNNGAGNYTLTTTFTPCALSNDAEVNNDPSQAQSIQLGETVTGRLGYTYWKDTDKYDWYQTEITTEGRLTISIVPEETLGIHSTQVNIYDAEGNLKERSYNWYDGEHVINNLAAGTFYIRVKHNTGYGGYKLTTKFEESAYTNDSEPNDEVEMAQSITLGEEITGRLGYNAWDNTDEYDWFKVKVPSEGRLTISIAPEETLGIHSTQVNVYDDEGNLKERSYNWYDSDHMINDLSEGTCYIRIKRNTGYGGYRLSTKFEECAYANDNEPNNDYTTAQSVNFGSNLTGRLGYYFWNDRDEEDWYKVELTSVGEITISVTPQEGLGIHHTSVHAVKNDQLEEVSYKWYDDVHVTKELEPGTYYICIKRNTGYGGYGFSFDTAAGIENIFADESAAVQYDLMGRQINNRANMNGLMIRNGKKVLSLPTK